MNIERLRTAINNASKETIALEMRVKGCQENFKASAMMGDTRGMDESRQQIHDLLDKILDAQASLMSLARTLADQSSDS